MKAILSAAALLLVIASPGFADEAAGTQTGAAPAVVEIVPTATAPEATTEATTDAMTEAAASSTAVEGEAQSTVATGGHGCASKKKTVYLTN